MAVDSVATDAGVAIACVAIETMAAQLGLTSRGLLLHLVGLYFPKDIESFTRRVMAPRETEADSPSPALRKALSRYGYEWDEESGRFVKDGD